MLWEVPAREGPQDPSFLKGVNHEAICVITDWHLSILIMGQLMLLMVYNLLNVHASLRLDLKRKKNTSMKNN